MGTKRRIGLLYDGSELCGSDGAQPVLDGEKFETVAISVFDNAPDLCRSLELDALFPMVDAELARTKTGRWFGWLEETGLPCAGGGLAQAVLGADRTLVKRLLAQGGLQQSLFRCFNRSQWEREGTYHRMEIEMSLGFPCTLQSAEGSVRDSPGCMVQNREELETRVGGLLAAHNRILAEEWVRGRRCMVAFLGGADPEPSLIGESLPSSGGVERRGTAAAALADERAETVRSLALQAYHCLHADGPAVAEIIETEEGGRLIVGSVDLLPDLRPGRPYARLWELSGMPYPAMADRLLELAAERCAAGRVTGG